VRSADELIDSIVNSSRIASARRRREIQRELRSHIEDSVAAAREAGCGQDEIEKLVYSNFGDPGQIAQQFAWVYRHERRTLRAVAYALSTMLLAASLSALILGMQAGLALGFGRPMMNVLASRHTVIEVLDILASVAAYLGVALLENLFAGHRFAKAVFLLTAILAIPVSLCAAAAVRTTFVFFGAVNGVFFRAVQLFVTPKLARAGIVAVCFLLAGVFSALLRSTVSPIYAVSCASWLAMGMGYQLMAHFAARVDRALLNSLQGIQPCC